MSRKDFRFLAAGREWPMTGNPRSSIQCPRTIPMVRVSSSMIGFWTPLALELNGLVWIALRMAREKSEFITVVLENAMSEPLSYHQPSILGKKGTICQLEAFLLCLLLYLRGNPHNHFET